MQSTRRSFLHLSACAALGAASGCASTKPESAPRCGGHGVGVCPESKLRLACQMWSVNDIWKKNPQDAFRRMRALGYEGVQSFGFLAMNHDELAKMLDDNGLRIVDMPFYMRNVTPDKFNQFLEFCQRFKIDFVYEPWWQGTTATDWRRHTDELLAVAAKFRQHGIRTGYHNHQHEMRLHFEGKTPYEYVFDSGLDFELDVGHVKLAGRDPVACLKTLAGRVPSIHAKPGGGNSVGGAGDTNDWSAIIRTCREIGVKWAVVECEERRNTFEDVQNSYNFLKPLV